MPDFSAVEDAVRGAATRATTFPQSEVYSAGRDAFRTTSSYRLGPDQLLRPRKT